MEPSNDDALVGSDTTDDAGGIVPVGQGALGELRDLAERAAGHAEKAVSANTRRAYGRHWKNFTAWANGHGLTPLPADGRTVALWLSALDAEGLSISSMAQALAAVFRFHRDSELAPPAGRALETTWQGIRRERGTAPRQVSPIVASDLAEIIAAIDTGTVIGVRDRSLLLVGFGAALRRSELAALGVRDVTVEDRGIVIHVRRSKTDQEGTGRDIGIPRRIGRGLRPIDALTRWLRVSRIDDGPLFRRVDRYGQIGARALQPGSIAKIIKRRAEAVGIDPNSVSGHSLRAGLVTSAATAGKPLESIMGQSGHASTSSVLRYVRRASLFDGNAAEDL